MGPQNLFLIIKAPIVHERFSLKPESPSSKTRRLVSYFTALLTYPSA